MSKVRSTNITSLRDNIYLATESANVTAIVRSGKFVGVLVTTGEVSDAMSEQMHSVLRHNPEHALKLLTKQAIG